MNVEEAKRLYLIICNRELGDDPDSVLKKIAIIKHLEWATGKQFSNTKEFHEIISEFISREGEKQIPISKQFRIRRTHLGLNQAQLANQMKVDRRTIIRWERRKTPLTPKAIQWISQREPNIDDTAPIGEHIPSHQESHARM